MTDRPEITITLTWYEMQHAFQVGGGRLIEQHRKTPERQTFGSTLSADKWKVNIEGAMGEAAVAKYLKTYWAGSINEHDQPDVGGLVEVRTCSFPDGWLWVWEKDKDERPIMFVTGRSPTFKMVGWIYARAAKQSEWWQNQEAPNNRKNSRCWFVPQSTLEDPLWLAHKLPVMRFNTETEKKNKDE